MFSYKAKIISRIPNLIEFWAPPLGPLLQPESVNIQIICKYKDFEAIRGTSQLIYIIMFLLFSPFSSLYSSTKM